MGNDKEEKQNKLVQCYRDEISSKNSRFISKILALNLVTILLEPELHRIKPTTAVKHVKGKTKPEFHMINEDK